MAIKKDSESSSRILNESLLWEAFRKGQNWAFLRIYNVYYDQLYYYGLSILNSENEVLDLLQDYFFKLWNKRWKLPNVHNIKAYLFKSFRFMLIDYFRSAKNQLNHKKDSLEEVPFAISHEEMIIKNEEERLLSKNLQLALNQLSNREKEAVYLRFFQGLEYKEIAKIMSLKYQSVRNLVHSALNNLREKI